MKLSRVENSVQKVISAAGMKRIRKIMPQKAAARPQSPALERPSPVVAASYRQTGPANSSNAARSKPNPFRNIPGQNLSGTEDKPV